MSSFVLSLVSPVLRKMVCGNFNENVSKRINLDDVQDGRFLKLVRLACGEKDITAESISEVLEIGALAERLQMDAVRKHVEKILLKQLKAGTCMELFQGSEASGLERLRTGCYKILRNEFQTVSHQEGFNSLSEEMMVNLLELDELGAEREEDIFEALVRWMKACGKEYRGETLLRKIRFGVINDEYLANDMSSALPGHEMLKNLVGEALAKKRGGEGERGWDGVERLCEKWMASRILKDKIIGACSDIFKEPDCIAIDSQWHLLVSDIQLQQVIVFNRDGSLVRRIGSQGARKFDQPAGVAVDRQGRIVVADCNKDRIHVFNADGSAVRCFATRGTAVGQLRVPVGVAIDGDGHIVVADCHNNRIQVFDLEGNVVRHFGSRGTAVGQFYSPKGVAVDGLGRIVVVDSGNHRVQVFNSDGSVALCFGSLGGGPGQLKDPQGVAVDMAGRVIVTDSTNSRVQVFNSDGSVAHVIVESGAGRLRCLCGVAVDGCGRIVVVETFDGYYTPRLHVL